MELLDDGRLGILGWELGELDDGLGRLGEEELDELDDGLGKLGDELEELDEELGMLGILDDDEDELDEVWQPAINATAKPSRMRKPDVLNNVVRIFMLTVLPWRPDLLPFTKLSPNYHQTITYQKSS